MSIDSEIPIRPTTLAWSRGSTRSVLVVTLLNRDGLAENMNASYTRLSGTALAYPSLDGESSRLHGEAEAGGR
jgi:hypothetical protein